MSFFFKKNVFFGRIFLLFSMHPLLPTLRLYYKPDLIAGGDETSCHCLICKASHERKIGEGGLKREPNICKCTHRLLLLLLFRCRPAFLLLSSIEGKPTLRLLEWLVVTPSLANPNEKGLPPLLFSKETCELRKLLC